MNKITNYFPVPRFIKNLFHHNQNASRSSRFLDFMNPHLIRKIRNICTIIFHHHKNQENVKTPSTTNRFEKQTPLQPQENSSNRETSQVLLETPVEINSIQSTSSTPRIKQLPLPDFNLLPDPDLMNLDSPLTRVDSKSNLMDFSDSKTVHAVWNNIFPRNFPPEEESDVDDYKSCTEGFSDRDILPSEIASDKATSNKGAHGIRYTPPVVKESKTSLVNNTLKEIPLCENGGLENFDDYLEVFLLQGTFPNGDKKYRELILAMLKSIFIPSSLKGSFSIKGFMSSDQNLKKIEITIASNPVDLSYSAGPISVKNAITNPTLTIHFDDPEKISIDIDTKTNNIKGNLFLIKIDANFKKIEIAYPKIGKFSGNAEMTILVQFGETTTKALRLFYPSLIFKENCGSYTESINNWIRQIDSLTPKVK